MTRYIDADEALRMMKNSKKDNPCGFAQIGIWYTAHDCCISCVDAVPTADVVPRAEVDRLQHILDSYAIQYGTVKDQHEVMDRIKQETAREIFEEIDAIIQRNTEHTIRNGFICVSGYNCKQIVRLIYELKNKYTEDAG